MVGFLAQMFCCCSRDRSEQPPAIDETTRLIPSLSDAEFTPPHIVIVDQQKMKDRLGTIVRAKEGKMVNVTAHLPFDLYNQNPSTPSSSRSASAQRTHSHVNSRAHNPPTSTRRTTTVNFSRSSNSRSQSSTSLSRNNSGSRSSSLYYNSIDYIDADTSVRHPTLNVRLVKVPDAESSSAQFLRQGRRRSRFGIGDPGPNELGVGTPPLSVPVVNTNDETRDSEVVLTPTSTRTISALPDGKQPVKMLPDFDIPDVGDISRSWGT